MISPEWAQLWVTKRAYSLGWTKERFPDDGNWAYTSSRERPLVERIGKKYQWIALYELLARLTDNVWRTSGWGDDDPKQYKNPCQIGFQRDVEPTIFRHENSPLSFDDPSEELLHPVPDLPLIDDKEFFGWLYRGNEVLNGTELLDITDPSGKRWVVLYDFLKRIEYADRPQAVMNIRRQFFTRVSSVIIPQGKLAEIVEKLKGQRLADPTNWEPSDITDHGYLLEAGWRETWPNGGWKTDWLNSVKDLRVIQPLFRFVWESHLDASLPDGKNVLVPTPWLAAEFGLCARPLEPEIYEDATGAIAFKEVHSEGNDRKAALISHDLFFDYLEKNDLTCLWAVAGERNAYPDGSQDFWSCRSHSALYYRSGIDWIAEKWHQDTGLRPTKKKRSRKRAK